MDDVVYVMGRTPRETARLQAQSALYNPSTRWLFHQAGLEPGMRVLDVGSGAGDVALLAADIVGPRGSVVGVDINGDILKVARERAAGDGLDNCTFVEGDIRTIDLPADFDAAVGRLVLLFVDDPVVVVHRAADLLRAGGLVIFQEMDRTPPLAAVPQSPLLTAADEWGRDVFRRGRVEMAMGLKLRQTFESAGLPTPSMHGYAPVGGGPEWRGFAYVAESLRSIMPSVVDLGVAQPAEVDIDTYEARLTAECVSNRSTVMLWTFIGAWSRLG